MAQIFAVLGEQFESDVNRDEDVAARS